MAYTQTDIDNLKAALASGVLTAKVEGKEVTYRSQAALERQLQKMLAEVMPNSPAGRRPRELTVEPDRG